ncbi:MAG: TonB-dependent receptor, partial [Opitutales bacterium]
MPVESVEDALTPFEKAELRRLLNLDVRSLARQPIQGVLGYEQEYWRNPASVHVIRPEDITLNGHLTTVEALRGVPGMHISRGLAYDNFVTMRNFSGFTTEKFFALIDGRESSQLMLGSANWTVDDYPVAVVDRVEIIRGPGASIWGTNAVNGVVNAVTKHASATQGDSARLVIQDDGSFLGDYIHGGQVFEDSYYRVWIRDQEYAEGTLNSGLPARDDGHLRKAGFRYDKELGSDLNLLVSGGYATRRLEHVVDLSNRLFYLDLSVPLDIQSPALISLDKARKDSLPNLPSDAPGAPGNWAPYLNPDSSAFPADSKRYEYYGEMSNDSAHIQARLDGVTSGDLEWSLTGYVDYSDIFLGHIGYRWEQREYDLAFRASRPVGDRNHLAFGLSGRRVSLDVESTVTAPWKFEAVANPYDPAFKPFA